MIILLPTIPHTGSHFVFGHLLNGYKREDSRDYEAHSKGWKGKHVVFGHLNPARMDEWEAMFPHHPIIVPLRHPWKVMISWERRDSVSGVSPEKGLLHMADMWDRLREVVNPHRPHYLPIDLPAREDYLSSLNTALNLKLKTTWPVVDNRVNSESATPEDVKHKDIAERIYRENRAFLDWFGYENPYA